ncbi:nuclear transport factor 2 family protein [Hydrogenophaga sp. OTU3427]|uniref:nuclear transport factor 2 family protein n=1 Tax=Hydrogenophaga sp. OTU3427 TaxID=3043856 RepID=UPI00313DFCAB
MPTPTEATLAQLQAQVQALADREAIRECLYRYCRGIDRLDEAALRSAYWPDATDRHGPYQGSAAGFIDWALAKLQGGGRLVHFLGNILIDLRGDSAAVESYFQAFQNDVDAQGAPLETFLAGRYIDRFERRDGEWRVAQRTVTYDWLRQLPLPAGSDAERFGVRQPNGAQMPHDPVYGLLAQAPSGAPGNT